MRKFTEQEDLFITDQYGKIPYKDIAKFLNRTVNSIKSRSHKLNKGKILTGKSSFSRKVSKTKVTNIFKEINPLSCYWAGFIAADGNIFKNRLSLSLAEKDFLHIQKFKNSLDSDCTILSNKKSNYINFTINVFNKEIVKSLKDNFNITERKTFTLKPPKNLKGDNLLAFLVGFIDGDGCIIFGKRQLPIISAVGASEEFITWIASKIENILELAKPIKVLTRVTISKNFTFSFCGYKASKFASLVLSTKLPFLERKWNKLKDLPTERKKNLNCNGKQKSLRSRN